uniref:3-hydroxyisobutyryl-CoA hydrolase, mitochondrial n=1 Tax=Strigamia maritima TaxID=126957 RepID=T1JAS2_STRMM
MITFCTHSRVIARQGFLKCSHFVRTMTTSTEDVLFETKGKAGIITLNRPKALNALNLSMARKIHPQLKKWETELSFVVIKGSGEKAFCAGGDIRAVTEAGRNKDPSAVGFFKLEYLINNTIGTYKIPYVALIHGITMGGGVGLSVHGKYRVATEKTVFAMPETAIGLFPDVGGSYVLPRLPNQLGTFYGLTGYRLSGLDVLKGGIATHFCEFNKIVDLEKEILAVSDPNEIPRILDKYTKESLTKQDKEFSLQPNINQIEKHFSFDTVEEILASLTNENSSWSLSQLETLKKMSPTSMKLTLRLIREGAQMSLQDCLEMEFRVVTRVLSEKDFYEGVRALLIDRDNNPVWDPATIEQVTNEKLQTFFDLLPTKEELKLRNKL